MRHCCQTTILLVAVVKSWTGCLQRVLQKPSLNVVQVRVEVTAVRRVMSEHRVSLLSGISMYRYRRGLHHWHKGGRVKVPVSFWTRHRLELQGAQSRDIQNWIRRKTHSSLTWTSPTRNCEGKKKSINCLHTTTAVWFNQITSFIPVRCVSTRVCVCALAPAFQ